MRNLFVTLMAVAGAVLLAHWVLPFGNQLAPYSGSGLNPVALVVLMPAAMFGAVLGALVGGVVTPNRR